MAGGGWAVVVVWVWWGKVGLPNTAEFNVAVLWWGHGVCVVCTKQWCFANKNYRRFDEGQFTKVGCKTNMSNQWGIVVIWE